MTAAEWAKKIRELDGKMARADEDYTLRPNWVCTWLFHKWQYFRWPPEASFPKLHRKCLRCNMRQMDSFPWGFR